MSKVIKAIVIGALIGLTGGLLLPLIGLGAPFAGLFGITDVLLSAAIGGAITGGLSALLAPSLDLGEVLARARVSVDAQSLMKWSFGETALATDLVWAGQHGADTEFYTYITAGAAHLIDSYGTLYLNDEAVTFGAPVGGIEPGNGDWTGAIWRDTRIGTDTQTQFLDIDAADNFSQSNVWPADADGLDMAHYRLRFSTTHEKFSSGIPTRITQVAKGGPVYDPRLDTTRGGTGTHRADDQTTWEYNDGTTDIGRNWALVTLRYLIGWQINSKLVIGVGIDPDDIDMDQAMAAANVCEATVDGEARYFVDGIFPVTNDHENIIGQLEGAINGKVATIGGKYYIWAPNDDLTPFSDIGEGDLLREVGVNFMPSGNLEQLYNTARGRYIDPSVEALYQPMPYPEVEESTAVTEDGGIRLLSQDFSILQSEARAQRVAREFVRRSRFGATWRFAMGPKGLTFQPFTVTTLNIQETNFENVTVRIINMSFSLSGAVVIECIEEDSSIYDTSAALGTSITTTDPGDFDINQTIDVTNLVATAFSVRGSGGTAEDGLKVTWDDPGAFVRTTEVQYRKLTDTDWISVPVERVDFLQALIIPLQIGTTWEVRARHITIFDIIGDWASVVQGITGADGTDILSPPDYAGTFVYDDMDTTGLAAGAGRYAMLTNRAVNTSGDIDNFQDTDGILINFEDADGLVRTGFLGSLQVGERITVIFSPTRWYLYTIDDIMGTVGSGSAQAVKLGVTLAFAQDNDPDLDHSTSPGVNINFEFQRFEPTDVGTVFDDPDFDLSIGLGNDNLDNNFWWESYATNDLDIPSNNPGISFSSGGGGNNSNAVDFVSTDSTTTGINGSEEAWLYASRRIRSNIPQFTVKVRWRNNSANDFPTNIIVQARGFTTPKGSSPTTSPLGASFAAPNAGGSTWQEVSLNIEAAGDPDAQYWEFRIGWDQNFPASIGIDGDPSTVEIDSVFVYSSSGVFGGVDTGVGLVPQAITGDDVKFLKGDGSWSDPALGGTNIDAGTALDTTLRWDNIDTWIEETQIQISAAGVLSIFDSGLIDSAAFSHDGNDFNTVFDLTADWNITGLTGAFKIFDGANASFNFDITNSRLEVRDGYAFRVQSPNDIDWAEFAHDGVDFNTDFTNTTGWNIAGLTGGINIDDILLRLRDSIAKVGPFVDTDILSISLLFTDNDHSHIAGRLEFSNSDFGWRSDVQGGVLRVQGTNSSGGLQTAWTFDPDLPATIFSNPANFQAGNTAEPSFNIAEGVAPTSPTDGDVWLTAAGEYFARLNGSSVDLAGAGNPESLWFGADEVARTVSDSHIRMFGNITKTGPFVEADVFTSLLSFNDDDVSNVAGSIGYSGGSQLELHSFVRGGHIRILGVDAAAGTKTFIIMDPDALTITMDQKVVFNASHTGDPSFNIPEGVAPSSPVDGDVWVTTTDIIARINGVSESLIGGGVGDMLLGTVQAITAAKQYDDNVELRFGSGNDVQMDWDGVDLEVRGPSGYFWNFRDGVQLRIYDSTDVDYIELASTLANGRIEVSANNNIVLAHGTETFQDMLANQGVRSYYNGTLEFETQDHNATDHITGALVKHWDGNSYDVGLARMPKVNFTSNLTISDTHWHKRLKHTGTGTLTLTFNTETSQPNDVVIWVQARDGDVTLIDGTMVLSLYDASGAPATGNITIDRGGWATITKDGDSAADVTGVGVHS